MSIARIEHFARLLAQHADATLNNWRPADSAPLDGSTIELRATLRAHYISGSRFVFMPHNWRPETPHSRWILTHWRPITPCDPPSTQVQRALRGELGTHPARRAQP